MVDSVPRDALMGAVHPAVHLNQYPVEHEQTLPRGQEEIQVAATHWYIQRARVQSGVSGSAAWPHGLHRYRLCVFAVNVLRNVHTLSLIECPSIVDVNSLINLDVTCRDEYISRRGPGVL